MVEPVVETAFDEELEFAHELADLAGEIGLGYFRGSFEVTIKPDRTPVTEADLSIESAIRDAVEHRYPGDSVLGEEGGLQGEGRRRWIVDPIDGTKNFADGVQIWSNLIALAVDDEPVLGVVNLPALGERYDASRGGGARMNGAPIHVSRADQVQRSFVVFAGMGDWLSGPYAAGVQQLISDARRDRGFGDAWGHCLVARGSADVMIELELATWDFAALQVIVEEAGGRITQFDGAPLVHGGTVLTTNGSLHKEVVATLRPGVGS
ncbi:MAG TPA: inositol monophosphatase family protein [Actinomycetota bacterium]|nr:inositol monophosphatase family protein [Actinomycetota bacterium]